MKRSYLLFVILVLGLLLAACSSGGDTEEVATTGGNPSAGEDLFAQTLIGSQPGCTTCHSLDPDTVIVGPSMAGVGSRAGSRVSDLSAEEYLRQSILEPNAYVVDGFDSGVMLAAFADELSDEQVDDLVAYLLTLE